MSTSPECLQRLAHRIETISLQLGFCGFEQHSACGQQYRSFEESQTLFFLCQLIFFCNLGEVSSFPRWPTRTKSSLPSEKQFPRSSLPVETPMRCTAYSFLRVFRNNSTSRERRKGRHTAHIAVRPSPCGGSDLNFSKIQALTQKRTWNVRMKSLGSMLFFSKLSDMYLFDMSSFFHSCSNSPTSLG